MQPLILAIYMDHEKKLRLEVIDLHFGLHEFRKYPDNATVFLLFNYFK